MINFDRLENESDIYRDQFHSASPFSHLVIDDFLTEEAVTAVSALALQTTPLSKSLSSDYVFAKNKIESPRFVEYSEVLAKLSAELMSKRFQRWLSFVGGEEVFLDPSFTGGGIHQGGQGSYLDMHTDFNIHPEKRSWLRRHNLLLYLNTTYHESWGGALDLEHSETGSSASIAPLLNRMVIMRSDHTTLHGYKKLNFPEGMFRVALAAYSYLEADTSAINYRRPVGSQKGGISTC